MKKANPPKLLKFPAAKQRRLDAKRHRGALKANRRQRED